MNQVDSPDLAKLAIDGINKNIINSGYRVEFTSLYWLLECATSYHDATNISIINEALNSGVTDFYSLCYVLLDFIRGNESNSQPLTKEQRELVYKLMRHNVYFGDELKAAIVKLPIKYYDLYEASVQNKHEARYEAEFIGITAQNAPEKLDEVFSQIKKDPDLIKYFNIETLVKFPEQVKLFLENKEFLIEFDNLSHGDYVGFLEMVPLENLKEGMAILKTIPPEVNARFAKASVVTFMAYIGNVIGETHLNSTDIIEVYKRLLNYDDDTIAAVEDGFDGGDTLLTAKHLNPDNLDFIAVYIKNNPNPSRGTILKILSSEEDLTHNQEILNDILKNKEKFIKQIAMRCKNTNPEFVDMVEDYINSEQFCDLMFYPNLSMNSLIRNLTEASKIFQFVDTKPQDYINGHYSDEIIDALKDYRKKGSAKTIFNSLSAQDRATVEYINHSINENIQTRFSEILDAIAATDIETVKLLLDKRFAIFRDKLEEINNFDSSTKAILSDVIRNGNRINKNGLPDKLTGQQKVDMIYLISCATSIIDNFDINNYKTPLKKGAFILETAKLHDDVLKAILLKRGISAEQFSELKPENLNWNEKYISLLFGTPARDSGELSDVVRAASSGNFIEYIDDTGNQYGQTNLKTRRAFEHYGLNYEQWLRPDVDDVELEVAGRKCRIKMWERNPQEDMFLGSKTSCCTALNRTNGGSMAIYMLNTSYNVVELYDASGEVVCMSRVFMANVDGKPTIIMDNIEINHGLIKDMKDETAEKTLIRDSFFKYMHAYAQKVTGNPNTQVLFYSGDINVPTYDLEQTGQSIDFIGGIHRENVYVNSANCTWKNPAELKNYGQITWLKAPQQ